MVTSTNPISNTVSTFVESQVPQYIRDNYPNFVAFLLAYYEWMEQSTDSAVITQSKSLLSYQDIDKTTDQFIQYYINDFLPYFPNDVALDERKLIKVARNFYQKKGSLESVQFLFRVLYNKEANIFYPKNQVLKTSDGKWYIPKVLKLQYNANNASFNIASLVGRQGLGSNSNASCVIESASLTIDPTLGTEYIEIFISNLNQLFSDLENLNVVYGYDANNNPLVFSSKIIASLSNIVVNPLYRGNKYAVGNPISIIGGLQSGDLAAQKAVATVNSVTSGSISGANVVYGGYGYRSGGNTLATIINAPIDHTGNGANITVFAVDSVNATYMNVNTDSIEYQAATNINASSYLFANNLGFVNVNVAIANALTWQNLQFAPIVSMNVTNGGGSYTAVPNVTLRDVYYTDYVTNLVTGGANSNTIYSNIQSIDDLGVIANVIIVSSGNGYSNVTDQIVVPSSIGYGATFTFSTAPTTNAITSVTITNPGNGYIELPYYLQVVNSANVQNASAGVGATLLAIGYGQNANISLSVNEIGQIIDFKLSSLGYDYVSTPNISVRVADIALKNVGSNAFITDSLVYQQPSTMVTWQAYVDSYNIASSILRVYNYSGNFNANAAIVSTTFNAAINVAQTAIVVYGDGHAKANAIFENGLITYPGFYLTTDGQLSSDQYLQDSNTYHNYSYVIVVEKALIEYKKMLMQLVHPIGMSMLGNYSVIQNNYSLVTPNANVNILPVTTGNIVVDTSHSYIIHGSNFGTVGNVGDLIVFNTSDTSRKIQVKLITILYNTYAVGVESNTMFFLEQATVNSNSNVITSPYISGNVGIGDLVTIWTGLALVDSTIQVITGQNTVTGNAIYSKNIVNTVAIVHPVITNASYSIIRTAT